MPHYTFTVINKDGTSERRLVEARNTRDGWRQTGFTNDLKKRSSVELNKPNVLLYDENTNTVGLSYIEDAISLTGARIMHYQQGRSLLPVYFVFRSTDGGRRAYQRPRDIEHSPEKFYQATQWTELVNDIYKNTTPMLEKITTIIWAAAGLLSLMVLFMLIFANGV